MGSDTAESVYTSDTSIADNPRTASNATGEHESKNTRLMSVIAAVDIDFSRIYTQQIEGSLRASAKLDESLLNNKLSFALVNQSAMNRTSSVVD